MADTSLLPIDESAFSALRRSNRIYVDKTELIYQIATSRAPILLSRPRRFGKSLLLSTFKSLFAHGTRDFKGLWIEDKWKDKTYRVIHLDFSFASEIKSKDQITEKFNHLFEEAGRAAGLPIEINDYLKFQSVAAFTSFFFGMLKDEEVVLLIDEYDAPLTHQLDNPELFEAIRSTISEFFLRVKGNRAIFRFVFITGITRYRNTSIFSGFNNLRDISLDPDFATILGYTEDELRKYFMPYIENAAKVLECTTDDVLASLKEHYDGYCFSPESQETVYTPWSTLGFMRQPHRGYQGYWYDSAGLPTIVVKYMQSGKINGSLDKLIHGPEISVSELNELNSLADMPLNILMYQTGYFTIRRASSGSRRIQLVLPNQEVKDAIIRLYSKNVLQLKSSDEQFGSRFDALYQALKEEDAQKIADLFSYVLNNVSYKTFRDEETVRDVLVASCSYAELTVNFEVATAKGRSDMLLTYDNHRYVFELKRQSKKNPDADKLLQEAKDQIIEKRYDQLQPRSLPVTAFAMVVDEKTRKIVRAEKL